jgi:hypothetical protein
VLLRRHPVHGLAALVTMLLLALSGAGCIETVHVQVGVISGDGPYRAVWKQSWEQIERDESPYLATPDSPGACNVGSTKVACVNADRTLVIDLQRFQQALKSVHVPGAYSRATDLTLLAISHNLKGLELRMRSLSEGDWTLDQRNEWFQQSKVELLTAYSAYSHGWAAFPVWARPSPAPRV